MDPADAPSRPDPSATPHNFDVQKEAHRRIRNDPDYDDWEYGTEPLPHEAWVPAKAPDDGSPAASAEPPAD